MTDNYDKNDKKSGQQSFPRFAFFIANALVWALLGAGLTYSLVDNGKRVALALESFGGQMQGEMQESNRNTEALATSAEALNGRLDALNEQMEQLNKCVMAITRDIKGIRGALEK